MKKSLLSLLIMVIALLQGAIAQDSAVLTAFFKDATKVVQVENDKSFMVFSLNTDQENADRIVQKSSEYGKYLSFTVEPQKEKNGHFICRLSFNHNARSFEFYKMFTLYGIEQISIEGKTYPLSHLLQF